MPISNHNGNGVLANLLPMRRYAPALTRDETAAGDLVNEALVRAYEKRTAFRLGGLLHRDGLAVLTGLGIGIASLVMVALVSGAIILRVQNVIQWLGFGG